MDGVHKTLGSRVLVKSLPWLSCMEKIHNFLPETVTTLLDVGCGPGAVIKGLGDLDSEGKLFRSYIVGLDIFKPYISAAKKQSYDDVILCDIRYLPVQRDSVEVVLAIDVIEHLKKHEGLKLLDDLEAACRQVVIIVTPVSFQNLAYAKNDNPYQFHKSGWWTYEFKASGYRVRGVGGLRSLKDGMGEWRVKSRLITPFLLIISFLSKFITYLLPCASFQMICVKNKIVDAKLFESG